MVIHAELGTNNRVSLLGPTVGRKAAAPLGLVLGTDYTPLAISGSLQFDLPLVFVGYGITAKGAGYDDYAGLDVSGKAVVILRNCPHFHAGTSRRAADVSARFGPYAVAVQGRPTPASTARRPSSS